MSKIVSGAFKAVKRVVSGIGKAVKKVFGSGFGRVVLAAAAIYFGGAFISGAMSNTAGGWSGAFTGGLDGMANAGQSLLQAGSSVLDGNFGKAGTSLSAGMGGGYAPGTDTIGAAIPGVGTSQIAATATDFETDKLASAYSQGGPSTGNPVMTAPTNAGALPAKPGFGSDLMAWGKENPRIAAAGVQVAGRLTGGFFQGKAAEEEQRRQTTITEDERRRRERNQSVGNIRPGLMSSNYAGWNSSGRA